MSENYDFIIRQMIYLCACAVNSRTPDPECIAQMDLDALYKESDRHMLSAVVAYALEQAGVLDPVFRRALALAQRRVVLMDHDMTQVISALEEAGIWYMPLKGAVLKDLYPVYGVRQMSDRDILIDASHSAEVRILMESLGFTVDAKEYGKGHHDCYFKKPFSNFEMHRSLFEYAQDSRIVDYYADVKSRLRKDEGNAFGWHFCPEDFYLHLTVHEYKHFIGDGTGLRSLLDTYVYLTANPDLNYSYISAEMEKFGVADFESRNRSLALRLFSPDCRTEETLTAEEQVMLSRFTRSGTYGSTDFYGENQLAAKGRREYLRSRLTIPFPVMQEKYPVLNKAPVLYPFCWIHRLIYAFFFKNKKVMKQIKALLARQEKE